METAGTSDNTAGSWRDRLAGLKHPGVYLQQDFGLPRRITLQTGVPAFLGSLPAGSPAKLYEPIQLSLWSQFEPHLGKPAAGSYLAYAVRGFFENKGERCYVTPLPDNTFTSLLRGLMAIEGLNTVDLVCAPDLMQTGSSAFELQQFVMDHCSTLGDRFALLDTRPGADKNDVWDQWGEIEGNNGAIYYPWVKVRGFEGGLEFVPPCGHVAGVIARTDRERGVHKAPANEVLNGVLDLECRISNADQDFFNSKRINCLRSFAGRGIRVWGARTLSGDAAWMYVNVRRVFLTAVRWIEWNMSDVVFEPNNTRLWPRIERELSTYFNEQFRAGALKGRTPQEAFYVKCDAETNPPELRNSGKVVTEIGLAITIPLEFVVVRLIHGESGVTITGPSAP